MDGGGSVRGGGGVGSGAHPCYKVLIQLFQAVWEREAGSKAGRLIQNSIRAFLKRRCRSLRNSRQPSEGLCPGPLHPISFCGWCLGAGVENQGEARRHPFSHCRTHLSGGQENLPCFKERWREHLRRHLIFIGGGGRCPAILRLTQALCTGITPGGDDMGYQVLNPGGLSARQVSYPL